MIASWKLKPITRCYTGKGQCDSNLRGRVVPGTHYTQKKKQPLRSLRKIEKFISARPAALFVGSPPITPYPMKFY